MSYSTLFHASPRTTKNASPHVKTPFSLRSPYSILRKILCSCTNVLDIAMTWCKQAVIGPHWSIRRNSKRFTNDLSIGNVQLYQQEKWQSLNFQFIREHFRKPPGKISYTKRLEESVTGVSRLPLVVNMTHDSTWVNVSYFSSCQVVWNVCKWKAV